MSMKRVWMFLLLVLVFVGCGDSTKKEISEEVFENIPLQEETEVDMKEAETESEEFFDEEGLTFSNVGITVTIPDTWAGKVFVQESEDGLSFFQKASYEKEEGMGFLYGFYKSDTYVVNFAGALELAYTDNEVYYIQQPTDVTFCYEDDKIAAEYGQMMEDKELLIQSLEIAEENVRYDANEYVLALSYNRLIPEDILCNMSVDELWLARNEIFARHGRKFTNAYLDGHFSSCSWYVPSVEADAFDENVLSAIEKKNIEGIKAQEAIKQAEKPYPQSMSFGQEYTLDLDGDGVKEGFNVSYWVDDEYEYANCTVYLTVGDEIFDLTALSGHMSTLNTDEYYMTDISPHFEGLEIAILDYGPSDDYETHFFTWNNGAHYIGTVGGFPFKEYMQLGGFSWEGNVRGIIRTDLIHTCFSYANWYYDYDNRTLELQDTGMYTMVPKSGHMLLEDMEIFIKRDTTSPTITLKPQEIYFLETDGKEWIKVRGKDGTTGYMHITDYKIDGVEKEPSEIITELFFAG